jgi:pimeloyl-ACP methyl ester carboxylesterase
VITLDEWERGGSYSTINGHRIFCREGGSGTPLVLIHGFPTASWDWEGSWAALTERWRVITLDMLGFGFSAKPNVPYSILRQADLFEARLKALGVSEYHVLAHDYGDTVAQELLARKPAGLKSMCFLNGGLFPETHRALLVQKLLLSPLGGLIARTTSRSRFEASLRRIFGRSTPPSREHLDGYWKLLLHEDGLRVMPKLIHYMPERIEHRERWVGALQTTSVPLKVIDGAADPVSGAHMVARYRELVPSPNVTLLEEIGHYPQVEAPQAVLEAYLEFRKSLS